MKLNAPSPPRSKKKGKSAFIFSSKFVNHFVIEKDVNSAICRTRWQDSLSGCITLQTMMHNLMQSHIKFSHLLCSITRLLETCYIIVSVLGKPTRKKSAVFFNIVQTGGGQTHVQKLCRKLLCVLEVI